MKKITALLLLLVTVISLAACGQKYEPVPSTEDELRVVMTLKIDEAEYDVKYELYRALFLANRDTVDGGDHSVWSGESRNEYIAKINEIIIDRASDIYGAIHAAKKLGLNVYSSEADGIIEEYIRINVEGNGDSVTGHGSYDAYLEALKKKHMNYAVGDLMLRYSLALDMINDYYIGEENALGQSDAKFEITETAVRAYYDSDDSVRLLRAFVQKDAKTDNELQSMRENMMTKFDDMDVAIYIISCTAVTPSELIENQKVTGLLLGRYALDDVYYSEYITEAFALSVGEVSSVIKIDGLSDNHNNGSYILYSLEKTNDYFTEHYDDIVDSYISNEIGKILENASVTLKESVTYSNNYEYIVHSDISMN